jgi:hypothetical protein
MFLTSISPATLAVGGDAVVSFGSGDSGGRLQARARGTARNQNASSAEVRSARSRIRRSDISTRERRRLLDEIDLNTRRNGSIRRGILADIDAELRDLA